MSNTKRVEGALLDIDGTLVLSNDAHAHAWVDAFTQVGLTVRFGDVRPLIGMGGDKIVPALAPSLAYDKGLGKQIVEQRQQIFLSCYARDLQPAPGSRALCERMRNDGLSLTVASSAQEQELQVLLKVAGIEGLVEAPAGSDGKHSKPAPNVVQSALERLHLQPEQAIMLGDTPYDIVAAARSGVPTIAFRCGGWDDARLSDALAIYDDPADLLAHYEQSPMRASDSTKSQHGRG